MVWCLRWRRHRVLFRKHRGPNEYWVRWALHSHVQRLSLTSTRRLISHLGDLHWPARSPELTFLDFFSGVSWSNESISTFAPPVTLKFVKIDWFPAMSIVANFWNACMSPGPIELKLLYSCHLNPAISSKFHWFSPSSAQGSSDSF